MHVENSSAITLVYMESSDQAARWAKTRFAEIVQGGGDIPLDEMAFLISAIVLGPGSSRVSDSSEIIEQMSRLDELAAAVPSPTFGGIAQFLFTGPDAFVGNLAEYYDPENSLLTRVLDRHAGIPISLSVIMMEVGRRLGVPIAGIGMPGHFLVGLVPTNGEIPEVFADPFHEGRILTAVQCEELFHQLAGVHQTFLPGFLAPVHPMAIVERMLNNLKVVYVARSDNSALHKIMTLRSYFPGLGKSENDEFLRLMAPLN
jgi:regulator of sirC expression with transglutaminase-like and TPR domain